MGDERDRRVPGSRPAGRDELADEARTSTIDPRAARPGARRGGVVSSAAIWRGVLDRTRDPSRASPAPGGDSRRASASNARSRRSPIVRSRSAVARRRRRPGRQISASRSQLHRAVVRGERRRGASSSRWMPGMATALRYGSRYSGLPGDDVAALAGLGVLDQRDHVVEREKQVTAVRDGRRFVAKLLRVERIERSRLPTSSAAPIVTATITVRPTLLAISVPALLPDRTTNRSAQNMRVFAPSEAGRFSQGDPDVVVEGVAGRRVGAQAPGGPPGGVARKARGDGDLDRVEGSERRNVVPAQEQEQPPGRRTGRAMRRRAPAPARHGHPCRSRRCRCRRSRRC